ncbi:MAG: phosphoribosylamine--glycine ligase [Pirellulaceae bacterium]
MKVLIVGNGGREHALAWKIGQSSRVDRVFVAPGNAGTSVDAENVAVNSSDTDGLIKFSKQNSIDLVVIGPEAPLVAGLTDALQEEKFRVFGPSKASAQLEGSKVFCKEILRSADVPTADYQVFRDAASAERYIVDRYPTDDEDCPVVVKADGLAAGKGVVVCTRRQQALHAIDRIARQLEFGNSGNQLVIEERLDGQEVSLLAITDGRTIVTLSPAQDHKPALDGDKGPNTGGMGAYCPAPMVTAEMLSTIEADVLVPTVHALKRARKPFRGVLYAGLMITNQGPKVLEYNVRFGDPECQPILMRLKTDLMDLIESTIDQRLDEIEPLEWDPRPAICVVMASDGYPGKYDTGHVIRGIAEADARDDVKVFHAGTQLNESGEAVTAGGRVLGVTALGHSISAAKLNAYTAVRDIRWTGAWCRKDISDKALT